MKRKQRLIAMLLSLSAMVQEGWAQRFNLFAPEIKREYPSVVYDFLEKYLYNINEMERRGEYVVQRLADDKVQFHTGTAATARNITPDMPFSVSNTGGGYYLVTWTDTSNTTILSISFPMQYELLLGKPKVEIEKEFCSVLAEPHTFVPLPTSLSLVPAQGDDCFMSVPSNNYYVESLNTAAYFNSASPESAKPTFTSADKWHSAANLMLGYIEDVSEYSLYIDQNLYGFKKHQYKISLKQWLAYCQAMKLKVYFAVEEERGDGLKALLIANSEDLSFNHMMSLIIPDDFVTNRKAVLKATLNAYIPTQNVKDLYQKYTNKPKKKI